MPEDNIYSNPFPASGVARLSSTANELLTITTDAVKNGQSYLDDYLDRSGKIDNEIESQGNVIAIVGEYGTGKTHIALELLHRIAVNDTKDIHTFYLDAPADSFLALYKERFIPKLRRLDVRERVNEYLSDIVARELEKSALTAPAAMHLLERKIPPLELIRSLGLMESDFMHQLHEQLDEITENKDFGTAFSLFLRPEFEDAVWEWLQGSPPDAALVDRGIKRTLDTDPEVLETIGVFAFLYGRQNHRFVLVIDEMEKVLSHSSQQVTDEATILAFKKLMEVIGKTRALLILCGLPDFMEVLPEDAQQRILSIVRPTGLSPDDTAQYIREAQKRSTGRERLKPFTNDTVAYVSEIAGGNARKVVRLCYHAFQVASNVGTDVTRAMLRETARDQFELTTKEDVYTEISRAVDLNGWLFETNKSFGKEKSRVKTDFWLPVGDSGSGCVILITRSLLHEKEVIALAKQIEVIKQQMTSKAQVLSLLIINGYLADNLSLYLQKAFDRVINFNVRRFSDDIDAVLKGVIRRLEDTHNEDNVVIIRDRVDQLTRQTHATRSTLTHIENTMLDASLVKKAVEQGVRAVFGQLGNTDSNSTDLDPRFRFVQVEFDRVESQFVRFYDRIDLLFSIEYDERELQHTEKYSIENGSYLQIIREKDFKNYLACIDIAKRLVDRFRKKIFKFIGISSYEEKLGSRYNRHEMEFEKRDSYSLIQICKETDKLLHNVLRDLEGVEHIDLPQNGKVYYFGSSELRVLSRLPEKIHRAVNEVKF